jgi:uncharacterized membrane protein HdeD (DUF308 family)
VSLTIDHASTFLQGAICICAFLSALFFCRFFASTKDRLFLYFASSFFLMGIIRIFLTFSVQEVKTGLYWLRFAAFLLIIFAIIDKNRPGKA